MPPPPRKVLPTFCRWAPPMSLWRVSGAPSPPIASLLEREEGPSLRELLEEESLLHEASKPTSSRLLDYLTSPPVLANLVEYVTQMPPPGAEEGRSYKWPYVASELLSSDLPALSSSFLSADASFVEQLLSLLDSPAPLSPVLAGYTCKILVARRKASPDAFAAFFHRIWEANDPHSPLSLPQLISRLMAHIGSDAVLQLLISLCVGEPDFEPSPSPAAAPEPAPLASWLPHDQLAPALLSKLTDDTADDAEASENAAQLLSAMVGGSSVPPCFQSEESCSTLVVCARGRGLGSPPHLGAMDVLLKLLSLARSSPGCCYTEGVLRQVSRDAERFFYALVMPPPLPSRVSRFLPDGEEITFPRPWARQRCLLLALFEEVLRFEVESGEEEAPFSQAACLPPIPALIEVGFFSLLLDLLLLPHSSNAVHMRVTSLIKWILAVEGARSAIALAITLVE
ncbi:MAG: hypothetical protein SGPRY_009647 [Prymnesium sp.]